MKGVIYEDYLRYGCPECGCGNSTHNVVRPHGYTVKRCMQCEELFSVLIPGSVTINPNATESVEVIEHPRKTIPWHLYEAPDIRPEGGGEYCKVRTVGYDMVEPENANVLVCYIKSVCAGIRITNNVIGSLDKLVDIYSHMDYRPTEPDRIQYKFDGREFDLRRLEVKILANKGVVTFQILKECRL